MTIRVQGKHKKKEEKQERKSIETFSNQHDAFCFFWGFNEQAQNKNKIIYTIISTIYIAAKTLKVVIDNCCWFCCCGVVNSCTQHIRNEMIDRSWLIRSRSRSWLYYFQTRTVHSTIIQPIIQTLLFYVTDGSTMCVYNMRARIVFSSLIFFGCVWRVFYQHLSSVGMSVLPNTKKREESSLFNRISIANTFGCFIFLYFETK